MRTMFIVLTMIILNVSLVFAQSSYSSADQDTQQSSKATTPNDPGYQNSDVQRQEQDVPILDKSGSTDQHVDADEIRPEQQKSKSKKSKRHY